LDYIGTYAVTQCCTFLGGGIVETKRSLTYGPMEIASPHLGVQLLYLTPPARKKLNLKKNLKQEPRFFWF